MGSCLRSSAVLLLLVIACCNGNTSPEAVVDDLDALIRELRNKGACRHGRFVHAAVLFRPRSEVFEYENAAAAQGEAARVSPDGSSVILRVNGEDVQVFEYENAAAAQGEAARVSPDGSSVGTTIITWVSTPHFYRSGEIIIVYVGSSRELISLLESVLGPQFAGG